MRRTVLTVTLVCAASGACAAQSGPAPIGRLFYTPAERAQLDVARTQKKPAQPPPTEQVAEAPPIPQTVTYGGIVRRSDGKAMLWINNRLVEEKEALSALNLKGKVRSDGAMTVQVPQTGGSVDVKVGQSVEVQTGRVGEARRPQPEAKPPAEEPAHASPAPSPAASAEGKPAAAPAPAPAAAAKSGPEPGPGERKADAGGSVGLKLDLGGRALDSSKK